MKRLLLVVGLIVCGAPRGLVAQVVTAEVGRLLSTPDWTTYSLSWHRRIVGPVGYSIFGLHAGEMGNGSGSLWGPGAELTLFRGGRAGPYLAGGLAGGLAAGDGDRFWSSWSAGLGYELAPLGPFSLGAEGRWRHLGWQGETSGLEFGLRLGVIFGGGNSAPEPSRPASPGATTRAETTPVPIRTTVEWGGVAPDRVELISSVLETATDAMGTPYKWGGTGAQDGGFDCSGLIQYAYGEHGITLPRRSVDQAQEGVAVEKKLEAIRPGDILTFSNTGSGRVTHVGLYLGDGRFIHSASDGVQVSRLSPDDVYGRWWYRRWIGARRVVR